LNGTVGEAKKHLKETSDKLNKLYKIKSYVSVNKALVTQASAAIPVLPLYISILFKVMKEKNLHEGCIEQAYRLFRRFAVLATDLIGETDFTDESGYIRLDDWEMREDVQSEVAKRWEKITDENLPELADLDGYRKDFLNLFGFELDGIDYGENVDIDADTGNLGMIDLTK
jgi:enoyl-[acyl-carrier protein] reductase/trans-2-enoyl-CoA reductase (NAD+)